MTPRLAQLTARIRDLEDALQAELAEKQQDLRYSLDRRRVVFEADVKARHRAAREGLLRYLARTRLLVVVTAPFIYGLIVPLALLDLFTAAYQAACFPVYGIEKVRRRDHIVIDRQQLAYLNALQKLNCVYCGYANGVIGWVREIAARTEAHWCPIKHARPIPAPHLTYPAFADFGDETAYQAKVEALRAGISEG